MKTYEEIRESINQKLQEAGFLQVTGLARAISDLVVDEISSRNEHLKNITAILPSNARGNDLDSLCEMVGISRTTATFASDSTATAVRFYIDGSLGPTTAYQLLAQARVPRAQLTIPKGTLVSDNNVATYQVIEDATFTNNGSEVYVKVQSIEPGDDKNVSAGQLITHNLQTISGFEDIAQYIKVENVLPISNGAYTESDDNLRVRLYNALLTRSTGSTTALIQTARDIPGVSDVQLIPNIYGVGTTGLLIQAISPLTTPDIISAVQLAVDNVKPIGEVVSVVSPTYVGVELKTSIRVSRTFDFNTVKEEVQNRLIDYINTQKLGQGKIVVSQVISICMSVQGVEDARVDSIKTGKYNIYTKTNDGAKERRIANIVGASDEKFYTNKIMCTPCSVLS